MSVSVYVDDNKGVISIVAMDVSARCDVVDNIDKVSRIICVNNID